LSEAAACSSVDFYFFMAFFIEWAGIFIANVELLLCEKFIISIMFMIGG